MAAWLDAAILREKDDTIRVELYEDGVLWITDSSDSQKHTAIKLNPPEVAILLDFLLAKRKHIQKGGET